MSRIVLTTSGSFGDVHPYIAVGLGLRRRGHDVTIATAEYYRTKIEGEGLGFAPVRPDFVPMEASSETVRRSFDPGTGANFVLRKLVLPFVDNSYADLLEACRGADLFVIHATSFAAPLVAEKLGLNWVSVVLSPAVFVSAYDPPVLPPIPWFHALRHLGPIPHQLAVRAMKALTRSWMEPIVALRRREGLRPVGASAMHDDMFSPFGTLAWFSSVLGSPQLDWPFATEITGFPVYDRLTPDEELDPALERFLDEGEAPVVFTLGSSAVVDADGFYEQSLEAVRRVGCRAVFLAGAHAGALPKSELPIFISAYAPYSTLFRRAAAVVHQGGVGTVGQALRAGVPMLVSPLGLDQPDNAYRVQRLGVARVLPRRRYNAKRAARHIGQLLANPAYKKRAREIGAVVSAEDGIGCACDALERICDVPSNKPSAEPLEVQG